MVIVEYVKKHPYLIGGGALGLFVLILIVRHNSATGASTATGIDPTTAALYAQQQNTSAALSGQSASIAGQQALATTQAQYGIDLAQIQANSQITQSNTAGSVALAQIAASSDVSKTGIAAALEQAFSNNAVQTKGIEASLAGLESNNQTSLGLAKTNADEQSRIAELTAGLQSQISSNQLTLGLAQTAGAVNIADTASNNWKDVQNKSSDNGLFGNILGTAAGVALAFL